MNAMNKSERFLNACRCQPVDCCPVWFMRQAGRFLPEYRSLRSTCTFKDLCQTPELAARVTLMPLERFDVDAAIVFSDLLVPLEAMGLHFEIVKGEGPVVEPRVRNAADVEALRVGDPADELGYVLETLGLLRRELDGKAALIGFAGAPFTMASYMVEGGSSRTFATLKRMIFEAPRVAHRLFDKIADQVVLYARAQVEAGAQAIQIFDSWGGALGPGDYRTHAYPSLRRIVQEVGGTGVPVIVYAGPSPSLVGLLGETGARVVSVDWRIPLDEVRRVLGSETAVQGNLDPSAVFLPGDALRRRVISILERGGPGWGHVFNLGHGLQPQTPIESVVTMVETVHGFRHPGWPAARGTVASRG